MINSISDAVRRLMIYPATFLDKSSNSRITPDLVSLVSLAGHVPVAYFISTGDFTLAAILLTFFGLLDAVDGALARLQNSASDWGMIFDASADRIKEVILFIGLTLHFIDLDNNDGIMLSVIAFSSALLISYVKAKGETAAKDSKTSKNINKLFALGIMQFQVRMFMLIVALLFDQLEIVLTIMAVLNWQTVVSRLYHIRRYLKRAEA